MNGKYVCLCSDPEYCLRGRSDAEKWEALLLRGKALAELRRKEADAQR